MSAAKPLVAAHRAFLGREGFVREEVQARKEEAGPVHQVADARLDRARGPEA